MVICGFCKLCGPTKVLEPQGNGDARSHNAETAGAKKCGGKSILSSPQ